MRLQGLGQRAELFGCLVSVGRIENYKRFNDCAPVGVGFGYDRRVQNLRVPDQAVFDLARPDPVSRGLEQVVRSALIPKITPFGQNGEITRQPPITAEFRLCGFGVVPVAKKQNRVGVSVSIAPMHRNFTRFACR